MGRTIGLVAWVLLGLVGLFTVVDLGFGPIVICPQCTRTFNLALGVLMMVISVAALVTNRAAAAPRLAE
jgi:hypothetical protein